jgi:hypothetical protein
VKPAPESVYVALLGVVRLSTIRILPTFVRFGIRIEHQLKRSPGIIGFRTGASIAQLGFFHLSAWASSDAIQRFVDTAPHSAAVEQLAGRLGPTSFRYWSVRGSDLPMYFGRELHRLTQ